MLAFLDLRIPPPVLTALTALVMWAGARSFPPNPRPQWLLPATLGVAALGVLLIPSGIISLRLAQTTVSPTRPDRSRALVVSGIFRLTRNPIYLGAVLLLTAWAMHLWQPQSFVAVPVFAAWIHCFQILPEERALRARFGESFDAYVHATRRWI